MFKKLSAIEICHRMAAICQNSADANLPGLDRERFQIVSDKFREEADTLALADLQQSPHWHIHCHGSKAADTGPRSLVRRMQKSNLKLVTGLLGVPHLN
ncbi:MAG: hypothetical protein ABI608_07735 [Rhizomicrobium sp.]